MLHFITGADSCGHIKTAGLYFMGCFSGLGNVLVAEDVFDTI